MLSAGLKEAEKTKQPTTHHDRSIIKKCGRTTTKRRLYDDPIFSRIREGNRDFKWQGEILQKDVGGIDAKQSP